MNIKLEEENVSKKTNYNLFITQLFHTHFYQNVQEF